MNGEDEPVGAVGVRVFETNVLHVADVIYWLDGATADTVGRMSRIASPLAVTYSQRPGDLQTLNQAGRTAFWRRPAGLIVAGEANDADRTRGPVPPFNVAGAVRDPWRRYNPRAFTVTLGSGAGHAVVLYPSPAGVKWPKAGGVYGRLLRAGTEAPVPWALLEVAVDVTETDTVTFRGQADRHGDFVVTMDRLPPLPENVTEYPARLAVKASLAATPDVPVDIDTLADVQVGAPGEEDEFADQIEIEVKPGEIKRVQSFGLNYLAVQ